MINGKEQRTRYKLCFINHGTIQYFCNANDKKCFNAFSVSLLLTLIIDLFFLSFLLKFLIKKNRNYTFEALGSFLMK